MRTIIGVAAAVVGAALLLITAAVTVGLARRLVCRAIATAPEPIENKEDQHVR